MKKATAIGVVLLFVGISIAPSIGGSIGELSTASRIEEVSDISFKLKKTHENDIASYDESAVFDADNSFSNTIYVDDDNTDGPWDGTQEHPYQFIQDAIDNATDGDAIFVYNGIYYENVIIDKYLELYGENREHTIIDGHEKGWVIIVTAQVTISNFTIMSSNDDEYWTTNGLKIKKSNYNRITNNIIKDNCYGLYLTESDYNNISNNIISNQWLEGIYLSDSNYNTIWENTIKDNYYGLNIQGGARNRIIGNIIRNNGDGMCIYSDNNYFYNNRIWDNERGDIFISHSVNNEFISNDIEDGLNTRGGILFWERKVISESSNNYWDGNYWGRPRIFPKIIFNLDTFEFDVDWHPA